MNAVLLSRFFSACSYANITDLALILNNNQYTTLPLSTGLLTLVLSERPEENITACFSLILEKDVNAIRYWFKTIIKHIITKSYISLLHSLLQTTSLQENLTDYLHCKDLEVFKILAKCELKHSTNEHRININLSPFIDINGQEEWNIDLDQLDLDV